MKIAGIIDKINKNKRVPLIVAIFLASLVLVGFLIRNKDSGNDQINKNNISINSTEDFYNNLQESVEKNEYKDSKDKISDLETLAFKYFDNDEVDKSLNTLNQIINEFSEKDITISTYELLGIIYKSRDDKENSNKFFDIAIQKINNGNYNNKQTLLDNINKEMQ